MLFGLVLTWLVMGRSDLGLFSNHYIGLIIKGNDAHGNYVMQTHTFMIVNCMLSLFLINHEPQMQLVLYLQFLLKDYCSGGEC